MYKIMDKILPNYAPDGPLETERKGLLSPVGDAVGQVLDKGLKPVGHVVGQVGHPTGEALLRTENNVKDKVAYEKDEKKADKDLPGGERIGGKEQTGQNPLGL